MGIIMTGAALYPFIEQWVTGDRREHHFADRPRNNPHRSSIGMAAVTFYGVLWLLGANDELSAFFHIDLYHTTIFGRFAIFLGPALAYFLTYRICMGLQRKDAEIMSHGVESGVIKRMPNGQYVEVHVPPAEDIADHLRGKAPIPVVSGEPDTEGIPPKGARSILGKARATMSKKYGTEHVPLEEEGGHGHAVVGPGDDQH
jgi:ubiquinol-cytochrome c reductase cytochrome b subunit